MESQTFKFSSARFSGSTKAMKVVCSLFSLPITMALMDKLQLNHYMGGGALTLLWVLGSVAVAVGLYFAIKLVFLVRRHTVVVHPMYVIFDGVQYTKNFGFTRHEEEQKSKIYYRNNGGKRYVTGYVHHEQGEVFRHLH